MGTVCYSITDATFPYCLFMAQTRGKAAVEIRLDGCRLSQENIRELFSCERETVLIATYHCPDSSHLEKATESLTAAIMAGADYVDIDMDFPEKSIKWLSSLAMNKGCRTIFSYHNYEKTDSLEELVKKGKAAQCYGADVIKIVTTAREKKDCDRVLKLYKLFEPESLIAFAMGKAGYDSRLASFAAGAPFFFVCPARGKSTAAGQPCCFDFIDKKEILLEGSAHLPASKSFTQRAIVLAALTSGTTKLYGVTLCDDVEAAIGVAFCLGAEVSFEGEQLLVITGHQNLEEGLKVKDNIIFVGESGLLARLCIPLAGLSDEDILITGEKTLLARKMDDQRQALRKFGLKVEYTDRCHLPVRVSGRLHSGEAVLDGEKGSQMISGLLLALSQCPQESTLIVENVTSTPYLDLTTYVASFFNLTGFELEGPPAFEEELEETPEEETDRTYYVAGGQKLAPVYGMEVEKDWSAAAMLLVAGAMMGDITLTGLDPFSVQADAVILDLLENLHVDIVEDHKARTVNVRKSIIDPFYYDIVDTPDLFAPLFVLAIRAEGQTVITGIRRLANKESNRAVTFVKEFRKLGVQARIEGDDVCIWGHENAILKGGVKCSSHGDHRLAMALSVASVIADKPIEIDDIECVAKSFPDFLKELENLKTR